MNELCKFGLLFILVLTEYCVAQATVEFTTSPSTKSACMGSKVEVSCVYNNSFVAPLWIIDGELYSASELMTSSLYEIDNRFDNVANNGNSTLTVLIINTTTSFQCRLSLISIVDSEVGMVTVRGPPLVEFTSGMDRCDELVVIWTETADSVCGIVNTTVRLLVSGEVVTVVRNSSAALSTSSSTTYTFPDFTDIDNYSVDVTATNDAGDSDTVILPTELITIVPQIPNRPKMVVADAYIVNGQFEITVSWQTVPTTRTIITDYMITVIINGNGSTNSTVIQMVSADVLAFDLPNNIVFPNTHYDIFVSAITDARTGPPGNTSINTFVLQGCTAVSHSAGVITVSCYSSHQIQATVTCSTCDTKVAAGSSPVNVTDLEGDRVYNVTISVYSGREVVLVDWNVTVGNVAVVHGGESDGGGSDNTGAIIGTVVGGICGAIVVVVVIVVVVYCCCCGKDAYPVSMSSSIPPTVQSPVSDKVPVDTNPAYALSTGGTIKMDDNPAYQTMTAGAGSGQSVKMTQNPAYALPM